MKEDLIGRNIRGFQFKSTTRIPYNIDMNEFTGKTGTIISYFKHYNGYEVDFGNVKWSYPDSLIEEHLIEEKPFDLGELFNKIKNL